MIGCLVEAGGQGSTKRGSTTNTTTAATTIKIG